MAKQEVPLLQLQSYLPEGSFEDVHYYLQHYKVHLTITRQRQSILGDYRHAYEGKAHRISINGNLNKYNFLITLLHELAHLFTYERYGHRVQAPLRGTPPASAAARRGARAPPGGPPTTSGTSC